MKTKQLKYKEVENAIRQLAKTLPPGSRIPSERELAGHHKCNFLTVRKALKTLVSDGTIFRKVGNGSFVAYHRDITKTELPSPNKINRIGALIYHQGNAYAQQILEALPTVALAKNIELRSAWIKNFGDESLRQSQCFLEENCSALILPWFPHDMGREIATFIQKCPLPVSIPLVIPGLEHNYFGEAEQFGVDLISSMVSLYHYFQHLGYSQIALLGPSSPNDPVLKSMLTSYTCLTQEKNLPSFYGLIAPGTTAMDQMADRWKVYRGNLAIISYDDEHALRFMTAMHKIGLSSPEDFVIIGHNNTEASRFSDPPLSTIGQDFQHVSFNLLEKAIALAEGRSYYTDASPIARVLVRNTCGGLDKINPELRGKFPNLDFILESQKETDATREKEPAEIALA